ncbi:hypothetical protein WL14_11500 [Burkholderia cepacia]|nr:hypothetical protein WJ46_34270 [Burkholderia cepacia]KVQ31324.1 hypothetical protein WK02_15225 [Burkholderia cepacia]KVZ25129.1 hypothetical protein WL14_11500 [Burkholderia cepacia]
MRASAKLGAIVKDLHRQGLPVHIPDNLMKWLDSAAGQEALSHAAEAASKSIAALNSEREIPRENLQQPITL